MWKKKCSRLPKIDFISGTQGIDTRNVNSGRRLPDNYLGHDTPLHASTHIHQEFDI